MANLIREVLNAAGMRLPLFTGGMSRVGINLSGTWTGVVTFQASTDGVNFVTIGMRPFPSGTTVQTVTGNGNWELDVKNYVAFQVVFTTLTTGSVVVTIGTSIDSSYQNAFLAATSIYVSQEATGGATNVITQAGQANRAWRLRTLTGSFATAAAAAVALTISDGASSTIWKTHVPATAGPWSVTLPADSNTPGVAGGGVVGTPGNSLVVTLAGPGGSVTSEVNCEFVAA